MPDKSVKVYSYHTFYFPFVWGNAGSISMKEFTDKLENNSWKDISVSEFKDAGNDKVVNYQSLQFFTSAARKSLFGWDEEFVRCFEYPGIRNKAVYRIYHDTEYNLNLDGIKLKVYNTGIAILTIEAENDKYRTMEDVKTINELGRRIFAPFFKNGVCPLCADKLGIKFDEHNSVLSPISQFVPESEAQCIPDFITCLLPEIKIVPAIDDRMFVACLVNDAEEFKKHIDYKCEDDGGHLKCTDIHLNYETNTDASKNLYEFFYIDKDDWCSCPTQSMRNKLISRSIYDRWAENTVNGNIAGTVYGVTHHSFVCLTTATEEHIIERPFLTIYTHMISAVLAQRASILAFDNLISKSSRGFEKRKHKINNKHSKELKKLQDSYIAFLNQHMNIEITCQEQGAEIYKMLQNEMYVCEEEQSLSKEISLLNNAADIANEIKNNSRTNFLTVISILLTVLFGIISAQPLISFGKWFLEIIQRLFNI